MLTLLVPSPTTMVSEPPGRAGTVADTWKVPLAVVIKQPLLIRLFAEPVPLLAVPQVPIVNHVTVVVPTVLVIVIGLAPANPVPDMTRVDPTVPDVAAV